MNSTVQDMLRTAERLQAEGKAPQAIAIYRQLLAAHPGATDAWYNLGYALQRAGQHDEALTAYSAALARNVSRPEEVHLNRAVIYSENLQRDDLAKSELLLALKDRPDFEPALRNLGALHENAGDRGEAARLFQQALALEPGNAQTLARYANAVTMSGSEDPLLTKLAEALARTDLPPAELASLGFALGRALDEAGLYGRAFSAYAKANRDSRRALAPADRVYDRAAQEAFVRSCEKVFAIRTDGQSAGRGPQPPIFICGMFRSGSTLVEQILAAHPRVTPGGELDFLPKLVQSLQPYPESLADMPPARLRSYADAYSDQLRRLFPQADRITDKRPDNFLHIGLVKTLFPGAKIINTLRHPLDNCLSVYFLNLSRQMSYALDVGDIGHYYRQYRRLMAHWHAIYGDDILDFDYDAYVQAPRDWTARLLDFCGLEWDDACLDFHRNTNAVRTASAWQVRKPLYTRSSGRWRNYKDQLGTLTKELQGFINED